LREDVSFCTLRVESKINRCKKIGHFGTGDFELTIKDLNDFEENKQLINEAYKNIGE